MEVGETIRIRYDSAEDVFNEMKSPDYQPPIVRQGRKIGRNDPCPCHSGKKFKKCCIDIKVT